jgi:hypothetical protein
MRQWYLEYPLCWGNLRYVQPPRGVLVSHDPFVESAVVRGDGLGGLLR